MSNSITQISAADCVGCGACVSVCPAECITMEEKQGFFYPSVNTEKCIQCGKCMKVCALLDGEKCRNTPRAWYAGYIKQEMMSNHSTSGGICTALSRLYLQQGHSVYAAVFDAEWNLIHRRICSVEELEQFSGSKYVQSSISSLVYEEIEECLKGGQPCLFIGTPCQNGALEAYLAAKKVSTQTLLMVDFMCHGVPSPVLGKQFIVHLQKRSNKKITYYNFRSKAYGWGRLARHVEYADGSVKAITADFCPFHSWFGKHLSLRESCFACRYRTKVRASDITVADFWGLDKFYPDIPAKQGICAVQINTDKGAQAYEALGQSCQLISHTVSEESVWARKTALANFPKPEAYDAFWASATVLPIEKLVKKYPSQTPVGYIKKGIKILLEMVKNEP